MPRAKRRQDGNQELKKQGKKTGKPFNDAARDKRHTLLKYTGRVQVIGGGGGNTQEHGRQSQGVTRQGRK